MQPVVVQTPSVEHGPVVVQLLPSGWGPNLHTPCEQLTSTHGWATAPGGRQSVTSVHGTASASAPGASTSATAPSCCATALESEFCPPSPSDEAPSVPVTTPPSCAASPAVTPSAGCGTSSGCTASAGASTQYPAWHTPPGQSAFWTQPTVAPGGTTQPARGKSSIHSSATFAPSHVGVRSNWLHAARLRTRRSIGARASVMGASGGKCVSGVVHANLTLSRPPRCAAIVLFTNVQIRAHP